MTRAKSTSKTSKKAVNKRATSSEETPSRTPATRYDWEEITTAFIEGFPKDDSDDRVWVSQKDLAETFGIPYQRVRERASKYRWTEQRHAFQLKVTTDRQKARAQKLVSEAVDFDERALGVGKVGLGMVQARLAEIAQEVRDWPEKKKAIEEKIALGIKVERWELYPPINYRELDGLSNAAVKFQEIGRKALGTDVERHEVSGPGGGPIETAVSVADELLRDDPERLTALLAAAERSGLLDALEQAEKDSEDIVDGEIVEDSEED